LKDGFENHRRALAQSLADNIFIALSGRHTVKGAREGLTFRPVLHQVSLNVGHSLARFRIPGTRVDHGEYIRGNPLKGSHRGRP